MFKNNRVGIVGFLLLLLLSLAPPSPAVSAAPVTAQDGNDTDCLLVAYTMGLDATIITMVYSNSQAIGQDLVIHSDCGFITLTIGNITIGGENILTATLPAGPTAFTVGIGPNNYTYSNVYVWADSSDFAVDMAQEMADEDMVKISEDALWWNTALAHIATFLILFFLSTSIVYRFAERAVDIEIEVVV